MPNYVPDFQKQDSFDTFAATLSLHSIDAPSEIPVLGKADSFDTFCASEIPVLTKAGSFDNFNSMVPVVPEPAFVFNQATKRSRHKRSATDPETLRRAASDIFSLNSSFDSENSMDLSDTLQNSKADKANDWMEHAGFFNGDLVKTWMVQDFGKPLLDSSSTDSQVGSDDMSFQRLNNVGSENDKEESNIKYSVEATLKRKARMDKMRHRRQHRRTSSDDEVGRRAVVKLCGTKRKNVKSDVIDSTVSEADSTRSKRQTTSAKPKPKPSPNLTKTNLDKLKGLAEAAKLAFSSSPDDDSSCTDEGISRGKYKCSRCGKPKEGHICPVVEARSIDTQCDLSVTGCPEYFSRLGLRQLQMVTIDS